MRKIFFLLSFSIFFNLSANHIKKGFKELAASNYSYALSHFQKGFKRHTAAAAYGIATLYFSTAKYNIDSTYKYMLICEQSFRYLDAKKRLKLQDYKCDSMAISNLKIKISSLFYERLLLSPSIESLDDFIAIHSWSLCIPKAIDFRDSLALNQAVITNTSASFKHFMLLYPESKFLPVSKIKYFDCQYNEETASNRLEDLDAFLLNYPENPHYDEVQNRVYEHFEKLNDIEELTYFIRKYENNRNVLDAWRKLYQLFMKDYSDKRLAEFKKSFPDFPFMRDLDNEINRYQSAYYPFKLNEKFGFIQNDGEIIIAADYDQVNPFKEGLSIVLSSELFGAIDRRNHVVIDFKFDNMEDFNLGKSIVEKDNLFGVIDRNGNFVFPMEFEDIGWLTDSLLYAKKNGFFGIYDVDNHLQSDLILEDIIPFSGDLARIVMNGKIGYLNKDLKIELPTEFDEVIPFTDSSFIYSVADKKGLVHSKNAWKTNAYYDEIYPLNFGVSMVRINDKIGYIDARGNLLLALQFDQFVNFSKAGAFTKDGAIVKKKNKYMLINEKGKILFTYPYESINEWGDWIPVMKAFKWGFINQKAKVMTLFEYDFVEKVSNSLFIIEKNGLSGLLATNGSFVLPLAYKSIVQLGANLLLVEDENGFGVATRDGQILIPTMYSQIKYYEKDVLILYKDDGISFYFITTGMFVHPK